MRIQNHKLEKNQKNVNIHVHVEIPPEPFKNIFMADKAIPMSFPTDSNAIYIYLLYIYLCLWPLMQLCSVYKVKEVTSFRRAQSINGCGYCGT